MEWQDISTLKNDGKNKLYYYPPCKSGKLTLGDYYQVCSVSTIPREPTAYAILTPPNNLGPLAGG